MAGSYKYELQEIQKGLVELELREMHPLRVYRPTVHQLPIHESHSSEVLTIGGKRCLAGWQEIEDAETGEVLRIESIHRDFHVFSTDPSTGHSVTRKASRPYIKGYGPIYRISLATGQEFFSTLEHHILSDVGWVSVHRAYCESLPLVSSESHLPSSTDKLPEWIDRAASPLPLPARRSAASACARAEANESHTWPFCPKQEPPQTLADQVSASESSLACPRSHRMSSSCTSQRCLPLAEGALGESCPRRQQFSAFRPQSTAGTFRSGSSKDELCYSQTALGYLDGYSQDYHPYDGRLHCEGGFCQVSSPSPSGALERSQHDSLVDGQVDREAHIQLCQPERHLSIWHSQGVEQYQTGTCETRRPSASSRTRRLSAVALDRLECIADARDRLSGESWFASSHPDVKEKPPGRTYITAIEFVKNDWIYDIEVAGTANYQMSGITHGNSGKTIAVVMEFASRILGIPITREDGTTIPLRFRAPTPRNPGLYWVIGFDVNHIGQTLYHRLFSEGLGSGANFRIIQDQPTGKWRSYNPNSDRERYNESRLSPPVFGPHLIEPNSWHMESAAGNIFKQVRLINGATLYAYPSTGDSPKKGDAVAGIWIDEDIERALYLKEWQDRLMTNRGWFLWSVWPQVANQALIKTLERAKRHADDDEPPIQVFRLIGSENPYSDKQGIAEGLARMDDDDDEAHRNRGDIDAFISGRRMYDFGTALHVVKPTEFPKPTSAYQVLCQLLRQDLRLPLEWTRYLVIDPSHTRTACLFGVIPPLEYTFNGSTVEMGNRIIIEQELVVRKHTPPMFAEALAPLTSGLRFEAFIMDQMVGRQTTVGSDTTVFQSYENQFRVRGIASRLTKSGFMRGCNDKALRRRSVRDLLEPTEGGWPRMWVSQRCYHTTKEFYEYRKKEVKDNEGNMVPTDDAMNERVFDCMAAIEYLGQYVIERFRGGTAYVAPDQYRSQGSGAYHAAMAIKGELEKQSGGTYAHYGPGAAA